MLSSRASCLLASQHCGASVAYFSGFCFFYGSSHWAFTPRVVVVAKPSEGVVFASFIADVFFNSGTPIPLCISGFLFAVFGGFEEVALGHHWDIIWRALRANLRSIKDFNANPKYYAQ